MESERHQWEQQMREPWGQNLQPAEAPDTNDNATYKKQALLENRPAMSQIKSHSADRVT